MTQTSPYTQDMETMMTDYHGTLIVLSPPPPDRQLSLGSLTSLQFVLITFGSISRTNGLVVSGYTQVTWFEMTIVTIVLGLC